MDDFRTNMRNKLFHISTSIFLIVSIVFSFIQYLNTPLYGDIQGSVSPEKNVQEIFNDPFGIQTIINGEKHQNPNRFFAQYFFTKYFQKVPCLMQNFVSPINSVYLASAVIKSIIQILFIYLLAVFISSEYNPLKTNFLLSAVIIAPLFQVYGYWSRMGIIDQSIAYTFFYAVPLIAMMVFLFPIIQTIFFDRNFYKIYYFLLFPFVVVLPFSGPLIPAVLILLTFFILISEGLKGKRMGIRKIFLSFHPVVYILLMPVCLMSLYSLVLGFYDTNFQSLAIPLIERFKRLPAGIYSQIFHSLGFPLLLIIIAANIYILHKKKFSDTRRFAAFIKWIGVFTLFYILLLPFGGYRPYRPNIIRYDTFMPVTVLLMIFFGMTTYYLILNLHGKPKMRYEILIIVVLLIYVGSDYKGIGKNRCERAAFEKMANSQDSIVSIPKNCFVMSWDNNFDYRQSEKKAEVIHFWGITNQKKLFFNEQ